MTPSDTVFGLTWAIDGRPFVASSVSRLSLSWTIDGPPLPSTILVLVGGELTECPYVVKVGGVLIDPSTTQPWPP